MATTSPIPKAPPLGPALRAITAATFRQVVGWRRLVGLGLMAFVPAVIFWLSTGRQTFFSRLDTFIGVGIGTYFSIVVPVAALIITTSALGDERRDGTVAFLATRPVSRFGIAAAKLLGASAAALVVTMLGAVALAGAFGLRTGHWEYLVPMIVGGALGTLAYAAIFLPLGYLTERATIIGLFYVFVWESAVAGTLPGLATTSPWRVGYSAFAGLIPASTLRVIPEFALGSMTPGAGGAAAKALVFVVLSVVVTGGLLRVRDLT